MVAAYYAEASEREAEHNAKLVLRTSAAEVSPVYAAWADMVVGLYVKHGYVAPIRSLDDPHAAMLKLLGQARHMDGNTAANMKVALLAAFKRAGVATATSNTTAKLNDVFITIAMSRPKGQAEPSPVVRINTAQ